MWQEIGIPQNSLIKENKYALPHLGGDRGENTPLICFLFFTPSPPPHLPWSSPWALSSTFLDISFGKRDLRAPTPEGALWECQGRSWASEMFVLRKRRCVEPGGRMGRWFSSVQSLSCVRLFATPWTAARQASLSIANSRSLLKLTSIELVMPSNHLILCHPLLLLHSIFPSIRVFSNESVLHIRCS